MLSVQSNHIKSLICSFKSVLNFLICHNSTNYYTTNFQRGKIFLPRRFDCKNLLWENSPSDIPTLFCNFYFNIKMTYLIAAKHKQEKLYFQLNLMVFCYTIRRVCAGIQQPILMYLLYILEQYCRLTYILVFNISTVLRHFGGCKWVFTSSSVMLSY